MAWVRRKKDGEVTEEFIEMVFGIIKTLDTTSRGADWDVVCECVRIVSKEIVTNGELDKAVNNLLDRGKIYEPILGRLKVL